jgi:hypothetical protein
MKLAILLFGISKCEYDYGENNYYLVDYNNSYENYKKYIFDYFKDKGYDIDIYFTTNSLDDKDKKEICDKYNPVKCNFIKNQKNRFVSRNLKIVDVIDLCIESGNIYDLILITRFDLLFQKNFDESNIQYDKFNLVSVLETPNLLCDNFYLFPYKYLHTFSDICKNNLNNNFHFIQSELYQKIGTDSVHYILNENTSINYLTFYKIVRTPLKAYNESYS